jgi:hypothetical protein
VIVYEGLEGDREVVEEEEQLIPRYPLNKILSSTFGVLKYRSDVLKYKMGVLKYRNGVFKYKGWVCLDLFVV